MKIAEMDNEKALDAFADILEPMSVIFTDNELKRTSEDGGSYMKLIQIAIKKHKQEIIKILATLDGVPVEEYKCNVFTLPLKVLSLIQDEELSQFFSLQSQKN